jgi:hypothetical protein
MIEVSAQHDCSYFRHANAWTETLEGIFYLIKHIKELEQIGDTVNKTYLARLVIISSCYLAEQTFTQVSKKYFQDNLKKITTNSIADSFLKYQMVEWFDNNTVKKIGISRAMEKYPVMLIGKSLDFGRNPMQSLKLLMDKRNDIIHKISDLTNYTNATDISYSAFFTVIEASKYIEDHFFPGKVFSYQEWLDRYPNLKSQYFDIILSKKV